MKLIDNRSVIPRTNLGGIHWIVTKREGDDLQTLNFNTCREMYTLHVIKYLASLPSASDKMKFFKDFTLVGCVFQKPAEVAANSTIALKLLNIIETNNGWGLSTLVPIDQRPRNKALFAIKPSTKWLRSTHALSLCMLIINSAFSINMSRTRTYNGLMFRYKHCNGKYRFDLRRLGQVHEALFSNWERLFKGISRTDLFTEEVTIYGGSAIYRDGFRALVMADSTRDIINNRSTKYVNGVAHGSLAME